MFVKFDGVRITGISAAVPKTSFSIASLSERFGSNEIRRIIDSTGIESARRALPEQTVLDLCLAAAQALQAERSVTSESIDALVSVTITPDFLFPGNSSILHGKLGLREDIPCFDIVHGCSGYLYGLLQSLMLIRGAGARRVLLLVGETASKTLDPKDRSTQVLFGDAGSATFVEAAPDGVIQISVGSRGSGHEKIIYPGSGFRPNSEPKVMRMDGPGVMEFILELVPQEIEQFLERVGVAKEEVGLYFLHQANQIALKHFIRKLRIDPARAPITLKHFGNTGAASIPLGIVASRGTRDLAAWSRVLLSGFGVGLSWGTAICDLSHCRIPELIELGGEDG